MFKCFSCLLSCSLSDESRNVKICIVIQWIMISDFYPKWPAKKTNIFNQYLFIILTWNFWSPKNKIFLLQFANKFFLVTLNIFKWWRFSSLNMFYVKKIKMLEAFIDSLSLYFNEENIGAFGITNWTNEKKEKITIFLNFWKIWF